VITSWGSKTAWTDHLNWKKEKRNLRMRVRKGVDADTLALERSLKVSSKELTGVGRVGASKEAETVSN